MWDRGVFLAAVLLVAAGRGDGLAGLGAGRGRRSSVPPGVRARDGLGPAGPIPHDRGRPGGPGRAGGAEAARPAATAPRQQHGERERTPLHQRRFQRSSPAFAQITGLPVSAPRSIDRRSALRKGQGQAGVATQVGSSRASVARGSDPWPITASWNARRSNREPSRSGDLGAQPLDLALADLVGQGLARPA